MKTLLIFLIATCPPLLFANDTITDERQTLKKWGLAYCLGKFAGGSIKEEADVAEGVYFQEGKHNHEEAYSAVGTYFNKAVAKNTGIIKETSKPNNIVRCLDAYESPAYLGVIHAQDKWID